MTERFEQGWQPQGEVRHELAPGAQIAINHMRPLSGNAASLYGPDHDPGTPIVARIGVGPFDAEGSSAMLFHILDLFAPGAANPPGALVFPGQEASFTGKYLLVGDSFTPEDTRKGFKGIRAREAVRIGPGEPDGWRFSYPESVGKAALFELRPEYYDAAGTWGGGELLTVQALQPYAGIVVHTNPDATPLKQ